MLDWVIAGEGVVIILLGWILVKLIKLTARLGIKNLELKTELELSRIELQTWRDEADKLAAPVQMDFVDGELVE